jgi:hypothetical protein
VARKNTHSRALRQLAEDLIHRVASDLEFMDEERNELVTSLVRQWVTYSGHSTLFIGDRQIYLDIANTPLGKPVIVPEPALHGWTRQLTEDWKVDPDDLPGVFEQLNRGQSTEVVNTDGVPLRLSVDPKERTRGVEPLVTEQVPPVFERDYRRVAVVGLEQQLGDALDPDELDALARSVACQWRRHGGRASIFLDAREEVVLTVTELEGGMCRVDGGRRPFNPEHALVPFGFPTEALPEVIARINLGQELEFRDRQGGRCRLRYDPSAARFVVERLDPAPPAMGAALPPFLCPRCTAVLAPWQEGQRQQPCPLCGHIVLLA